MAITEDPKKPQSDGENQPLKKAAAPKVTSTRRVRPLVEGINAPVKSQSATNAVKPKLTLEEEQLIGETDSPKLPEPILETADYDSRLLSVGAAKRANRKSRNLGKIIITGIILLLLAFGAYKAYLWYLSRPSGLTVASNGNSDQQMSSMGNPDASATPTLIYSSSTPDMTASSTFPLAGMDDGSTTPTTTPIATPTPAPQLKINSTPTGYLNVRNAPSPSGNIVTQVHPGETYPYTATQNGWYQITLTNGTSGWVSGQYVSVR